MTLKKSIITVCQNYFEKQCLHDTATDETIFMSVDHEQKQRRLKMQTIGCLKYGVIIK